MDSAALERLRALITRSGGEVHGEDLRTLLDLPPSVPDDDLWAYRPEHLVSVLRAHDDLEAGNVTFSCDAIARERIAAANHEIVTTTFTLGPSFPLGDDLIPPPE